VQSRGSRMSHSTGKRRMVMVTFGLRLLRDADLMQRRGCHVKHPTRSWRATYLLEPAHKSSVNSRDCHSSKSNHAAQIQTNHAWVLWL